MYTISLNYTYVHRSYGHFKITVVAILKIQNGRHQHHQVTCLHFLNDSTYEMAHVLQISRFYDNLNNSSVFRPLAAPLLGRIRQRLKYMVKYVHFSI